MRKRIILTLSCTALLAGCASDSSSSSTGLYSDLMAKAKYRNLSAAAIFQKAKKAQDREDYSSAVTVYESLESLYPYGPYAEQAQLNTAYCYYRRGESEAAEAAASHFIRLHPANPHVDYAWYLKGIAYYQSIRGAEWNPRPLHSAFDTLETVVKRWPNSAYAADARQRMAKIIDILGRRQLDICRFYYIRHAYVAAANRCESVVSKYQLSPSRQEALYYLTLSYRHLHMKKMASTTLAILKHNYPKGSYTRDLQP